MKKYIILVLIISGLTLPAISFAGDLSGPLVPCGTSANPAACTLCDLFTMIQTLIDFITAGIFILAGIFITAGGLMILLAGANPGNLDLGKKMITNAVIGVIIALLAWTVINMVFNTLVSTEEDRFPAPWNKIECTGGGVVETEESKGDYVCTCGENSKVGSKEFLNGIECSSQCSNYCKTTFGAVAGGDYGCCSDKVMENGCFASPPSGEWCKRPAPSGSDVWILGGINSGQKGDANASLTNFLNCMYREVIRAYGSTNNLTITSISDDGLCSSPPTCNPATGAGCAHTVGSCHYGGPSTSPCFGSSSAVDFRANATTCAWLAQTARYCGGSNAYWINWETNPDHLHVSLNNGTCGCNEGATPNPCP